MNQGEMIGKNVFYQLHYSKIENLIRDSVTLSGSKFNFIFDTGAPLCISKELQAKFHYKIIERAALFDSNNNSDTTLIVCVDTISFGQITFTNIPAVVLDLRNSPLGSEHVEGLLGSNVIRFLTVQFDTKNQSIRFTDNNSLLNFDSTKSFPLFKDEQSNVSMLITFNNPGSSQFNSFTDTAYFDTGSKELCDMNLTSAKKYIAQNSIDIVKKRKSGNTSSGILGKGKSNEQIKLAVTELWIGSINIHKTAFQTTSGKSRIGRELFRYGVLTVDYKKSRFYL